MGESRAVSVDDVDAGGGGDRNLAVVRRPLCPRLARQAPELRELGQIRSVGVDRVERRHGVAAVVAEPDEENLPSVGRPLQTEEINETPSAAGLFRLAVGELAHSTGLGVDDRDVQRAFRPPPDVASHSDL